MSLISGILKGSEKDISKLISLAENDPRKAREEMKAVFRHTGKAHTIGVTGPPGTGKSTLIYSLAKELRKKGKKVGIILVDPTSAFTGGALLGDRIRMQELAEDKGIYIRSMGSRGAPGGISLATGDAIRILDAAGKDVVIVETVGAGQSEIDVRKFVHTIVLVTSPGLGDEIQALKAGLMEIADVFVVNKADRDGADEAVREIEASIVIGAEASGAPGWKPPILRTKARSGEGVCELCGSLEKHASHLKKKGIFGQLSEEAAYDNVLAIVRHNFDIFIEKALEKELRGSMGKAIKKKDIYTIAEDACRKHIKDFDKPFSQRNGSVPSEKRLRKGEVYEKKRLKG